MNRKIMTVLLAAAALCMVSCGNTAEKTKEETETGTSAAVAATSAAPVTVTQAETTAAAAKTGTTTAAAKTETAAAETTKQKSKKKKVTTTTMDPMLNAITWNHPELKEPVKSYMEYAAENPVTSEPDIKTFEDDCCSFEVDMTQWEQADAAGCKYAFKRIDENRLAYLDISYIDYDEGTLPAVGDFIRQVNHDYSLLGFPEDKDDMESQLFADKIAGYDAVVLYALVAGENSRVPSERFGAAGVIADNRLYQIRYSYPAYMPYADTGIEDILDSLIIRLPE